jgi:hypothetical protein
MEARNISRNHIKGYGVDEAMDRRLGVPMESPLYPLFAHFKQIPEQQANVRIFKHVGLDKLTPVFGSAQPPRGLSGVLRTLAYRIPEHKATHWSLLLISDRVDVLEGLLIDSVTRKPYLGICGIFAGIGIATWAGIRTVRKNRI